MSTQFLDTKRTAETGDLVISLSEIFDRLESKVDPKTLEQLLRDIVSERRKRVRPGELITAELINQILEELESLEERVRKLEAKGETTPGTPPPPKDPKILDWQPREVEAGQRLDVKGENFPAEPNEKSVDIEGIFIQRFLETSATKLSFGIPTTVRPGKARMTIRNESRSDSATINVVEEKVTPKGELIITDVTKGLEKFEIGKTFPFIFELDSQTIPSEDYKLAVNFNNPVGAATGDLWLKNTQLLLPGGKEVPSPLKLGPKEKVRVEVHVRIPDGAVSVNMSLRLTSVNAPGDPLLNRSSKPIPIAVGGKQEVSDPRITFSLSKIGSAAPARLAVIDGADGVEIIYGANTLIPVKAMFEKAGSYQFSASLERPDEANWAIKEVTPAGFKSGEKGEQGINVNITLIKSAPDAGDKHTEKNGLIVTATNVDEKFSSFTRIPIQGFEQRK